MWKHACAFTKWVPSNQFMYANIDYNDETMTLERFGFIGMDRRCFWGSIGVLWKRPLPVEQILPNVTALVEPPTPAPVPIKLPYDIFEIQSIVNPGETNNDVEIVETEGEEGTIPMLCVKDSHSKVLFDHVIVKKGPEVAIVRRVLGDLKFLGYKRLWLTLIRNPL